jgi:uncharacterized damage-inducible protein DinB
MKLFSVLLAGAALTGSLFAQPKGAPVDLAADLKQNYIAGKTKILAAAEQMPEDQYGFKASPDSTSFGGWVAHLADLQAQFCSGVNNDPKQLNAAQKTSKADLIAALKESFTICDKAYDETTAANALSDVQTFRGPRPRAAWLWFNVAHSEEGYGSMAVLLRFKNVVPPSTAARQKGKGK